MIESTLRFDDLENVPGLLPLLWAVQRSCMQSRERSGRRPGNKATCVCTCGVCVCVCMWCVCVCVCACGVCVCVCVWCVCTCVHVCASRARLKTGESPARTKNRTRDFNRSFVLYLQQLASWKTKNLKLMGWSLPAQNGLWHEELCFTSLPKLDSPRGPDQQRTWRRGERVCYYSVH